MDALWYERIEAMGFPLAPVMDLYVSRVVAARWVQLYRSTISLTDVELAG
jgi:hypothetical protein